MFDKYKQFSFRKKLAVQLVLVLVIYLVFFALMQVGIINRYYTGILLSTCINIILVVSLNITTGFLGQLTLGHAGFMAIGAYSAAFFSKNVLGLPEFISFPIALLVGGIMAMLFGALVCIPTLRLKGDYLAIITLAFGEVIKNILLNLDIVGGASGYIGIPRHSNFTWAFWLAVLTVVLTRSLIESRYGRAMISIKEDEIAAESSGLNVKKYKVLAFVFAAFFAGIAGGLYAHYMGILEPKTFRFDKSIEILVMVVLGGMGSIKGSVIAAIVLTILPEALRSASSYRMLMYALALIIMMLSKHSPRFNAFISKVKAKLGAYKDLLFKRRVKS